MQNTILFLNRKYIGNKIFLNIIKIINNINNLNIFEIKRAIGIDLFA